MHRVELVSGPACTSDSTCLFVIGGLSLNLIVSLYITMFSSSA
jgi:hypothetical protein